MYMLVVLLTGGAVVQGTLDACDPCITYKMLHRPGERGTGCSLQHNQVCDRYAIDEKEWYLVQVGEENLTMVEQEPEINSCGTSFPIWMNGTHPTQNGTSENVTACVKNKENSCYSPFNITVLNCGKYFVYSLKITNTCQEAYCFGQNKSCIIDESGDNNKGQGTSYRINGSIFDNEGQGRPCGINGSIYDNEGSRPSPNPVTKLLLLCLFLEWMTTEPAP